MKIHYRELAHSIAGQGKYGYYESITYVCGKRNEILRARTQLSGKEWPLQLVVMVPINNHQDLERFTDAVLDAFDNLNGEHGEKELISPSAKQPLL